MKALKFIKADGTKGFLSDNDGLDIYDKLKKRLPAGATDVENITQAEVETEAAVDWKAYEDSIAATKDAVFDTLEAATSIADIKAYLKKRDYPDKV